MPTMIFPDTPIWGVLYDYIRGKKKYPKWHGFDRLRARNRHILTSQRISGRLLARRAVVVDVV